MLPQTAVRSLSLKSSALLFVLANIIYSYNVAGEVPARTGSKVEPKFTLLPSKADRQSSAAKQQQPRCGTGPPSVLMLSKNPSFDKTDDMQVRNVKRFLTTTRRLLQHFPWIAKIDVGLSSLQRRICAAALIGPNTAVTAARCFYGGSEGVTANPSTTIQALTRRSQITFFVDDDDTSLARAGRSTDASSRSAFVTIMKNQLDLTSPVVGALIKHEAIENLIDNYTLLTRPLRDVFIHPTANLALVRFATPPSTQKSNRGSIQPRQVQFLCLPRNLTSNATVVKSAHDSPWLAASNFFVSLMPSAPQLKAEPVRQETTTTTSDFVDTWPYRPPLLFNGTEEVMSNQPFINFDSQLAFKLVNTAPYALLEPMGDVQCALVMAIATGAPPTRYLRDKKCFTNAAIGEVNKNVTKQAERTTLLQPRLCADVDIGVPLVKLVDGSWTLFGILSETVKCPSKTVTSAVPQLPGVVQVSDVQFIRDELKPTLFTDLKHYRRWIEDQMRN